MSLSDASTAFSAARFAMNPTPLGAASLIGGALLGGKGSRERTYKPQVRIDPKTNNYQLAKTITGQNPDGLWQDASSTWSTPGYQQGSVLAKPVRDSRWNPLNDSRGSSIADLAAGKKPLSTAEQVAQQTWGLRDRSEINAFVAANPNGRFADLQPNTQALAKALKSTPPTYMTPQQAMAARA
jgi:hypothetical protein